MTWTVFRFKDTSAKHPKVSLNGIFQNGLKLIVYSLDISMKLGQLTYFSFDHILCLTLLGYVCKTLKSESEQYLFQWLKAYCEFTGHP